MKNNLKITFSIVLIMLLGSISCKKDSEQANSEQIQKQAKQTQKQGKGHKEVTIFSRTFKDGLVDHHSLSRKDIDRPHVSWEALPLNTKGVWIIMDDDKNRTYWAGEATKEATSLSQEKWDKSSPRNFTIPNSKDGIAVLEVFALSCTPTDFTNHLKKVLDDNHINQISRLKLNDILQEQNLLHLILASKTARYRVK